MNLSDICCKIRVNDSSVFDKEWNYRLSSYTIIWINEGYIELEIDGIKHEVKENELIAILSAHSVRNFKSYGKFSILSFDNDYFCIYENDKEVSCAGVLINGSSLVRHHKLDDYEKDQLNHFLALIDNELKTIQFLFHENIRCLIKSLLIICTRIAKRNLALNDEYVNSFELMRQFVTLVDLHYNQKHCVADYAEMLGRSPKTISRLLAENNLRPPLKIIHDRIIAEAQRLATHTDKSIADIALLVGFEDTASLSRFFKKHCGITISEYRKLRKEKLDLNQYK